MNSVRINSCHSLPNRRRTRESRIESILFTHACSLCIDEYDARVEIVRTKSHLIHVKQFKLKYLFRGTESTEPEDIYIVNGFMEQQFGRMAQREYFMFLSRLRFRYNRSSVWNC